MKINSQKVFTFIFQYIDNMEMGFSIVSETQDEAAKKLQKWMTSVIAEISMTFPAQAEKIVHPTQVALPLNDLQIGHITRIVEGIAKYRVQEATLEETVKKWTDVDLTPESFLGVIQLLEQMKREYEASIQVIDSTQAYGENVKAQPSADQAEKKKK